MSTRYHLSFKGILFEYKRSLPNLPKSTYLEDSDILSLADICSKICIFFSLFDCSLVFIDMPNLMCLDRLS